MRIKTRSTLNEGQAASERRGRQSGFTMIEVMVSIVLLVIASGTLISAMISHVLLGELNEEMAIAEGAARRALEEVEDAAFEDVFVLYNDDPADDPVGGAPGSGFTVLGLGLQPGDADGLAGRIIVPQFATAGGTQLREDIVDQSLGMPRDLDLNGVVDSDDHASDYRVLPVRVIVQWSGATGAKQLELQTLLFDQG